MRNLFRQNPLAFALAATAIALAAIIVAEVAFSLWPREETVAAKPVPPSDVKMLPPVVAVLPDQAYPETASRPLFTPTRRPAPPATSVAGSMTKGLFTLQGVIAVGDHRIALLREKSSGKMHRVERGKEVSGMTLSVVDNDRVTLAQGGDEEVLTLQVQKGPAVATAAGAAPAVAQGPFAPAPGAGQPAPGTPVPGMPAAAPQPTAPPQQQPAATAATPAPANPAQRSGFGPFANQPAATTSEAAPMTPEELLARRRARRGQQQPNQ